MANVYLLNVGKNAVTMGNVFTTANKYLYRAVNQYSASSSFAFTKTLQSDNLELYRESDTGIKINNFSDISTRESLPPTIPTKGPFIENYSVNGTLNTDEFINLLLIDKPPVRTGFFQFYISGITFTGFVTRQTKYKQYNWEFIGSKYGYVEKEEDLGYGIEISRNLLYTAELVDGSYVYTPTTLNLFLNSLNGSEEIVSTVSAEDPNNYNRSIPGEPENTNNALPVNLFYISAADALRFIASYPDLISSLGTDYAAAQLLYATNRGDRTITFDPISYLNKYSDIRTLFGYDTYAATEHFITTGYYQGRSSAGGSTSNPLTGGLYDERNGTVSLDLNSIIWPLGKTIESAGSSLTYKYNTTSFFINSSLPVAGNLLYLGIQ